MKCIKHKTNEVVERVSNEAAARAVTAGTAHYVPKSTWKKACADGRKIYAAYAAAENKVRNKLIHPPQGDAESKRKRRAKRKQRVHTWPGAR